MMSSSGWRLVSSCGVVAGEAVEVGDGDGALALGAGDVNGGVERGQGDAHVGGIGGDAADARVAPRMAWMRLKPLMAAQPQPGVRLLHAGRRCP